MIITFVVQAASLNKVNVMCNDMLKGYTNVLWNDGCKVKTPYCKHMFIPHCDCASIDIWKHNMTRLPNEIVDMTNLRTLGIRNGPLMELPDNMENLNKLTTIDFEFNRLKKFDVDTSKYEELNNLIVRFNNITYIHKSIWKHRTVTAIILSSNIGLELPTKPEDIYLQNIFYLDIQNNSVLLPSKLGKEQLPSIATLSLDGNKMPNNNIINIKTLALTLDTLGLARCGLKLLPAYLKEFKYLQYLDARNNNLTSISKDFFDWITDKKVETHFSGNGILCSEMANTGYEKYCEPLCSKFCWSMNHKDGFCDPSCNSEKCEYDGGDCNI
eukprot:g9750.t1